MIARVNGEDVAVRDGMSIADFVKERGLDPQVVVAEHNGMILACGAWGSAMLKDGDSLELVAFVGGG